MFAVIKTGGKQYKVALEDILRVEKLAGEPGDIVELDAVLMLGGESGTTLGTPLVAGATVAAEVVEQTRGDKIVVFKKQRRKHYRRRHGHRQEETVLRIAEILTDGKKPSRTKVERPERKAAAPKKTAAKKTAAKKAPVKEAAAKAASAKKAAAKKTAATKTAAKKAPAKKTAAKKTAAKKTAKKKE